MLRAVDERAVRGVQVLEPHSVLGERELGVTARGVTFGAAAVALGLAAEDDVRLDRDFPLVRDFDEDRLIVGHMSASDFNAEEPPPENRQHNRRARAADDREPQYRLTLIEAYAIRPVVLHHHGADIVAPAVRQRGSNQRIGGSFRRGVGAQNLARSRRPPARR